MNQHILKAARSWAEYLKMTVTDLETAIASETTAKPTVAKMAASPARAGARKQFSEETKRRMSEAMKRRWAKNRKKA